MKLLFLIENDTFIGGGTYSILKFAEYLAKSNHKIKIFAKNRITIFEDKLSTNLDIKVRGALKRYFKGCEFINRIYSKIYTQIIIKRYLKQNKDVDYIVGNLREEAILAVKLGREFNKKTANFVFESPPWMQKDLGNRWRKEYKGKFRRSWEKTKIAYQDSTVLVSNSKLSQLECQNWTGREVEGFVYPGIEPKLIQKLKIKKKYNQIIYIGRLNEYKNIDLIIKALSMINNPPRLIIIGDGEEKENLVRLSKKLSVDVKFKGQLNDRDKFNEIKKSLFMVFPSSHEGFGMPPMEALCCKIPCICSDKTIFKEVYRDKVEYFKENNVIDLKNKINFLTENKKYCNKRGKEGRDYVLKNFNWKKSAKKIIKILNKFSREGI